MSGLSAVGSGGFAIFQKNLFSKIDTNGDGSITQSELEQAVTSAGGSTQGADALYANLDPNNTGSVSEQQFSQKLSAPFSDQVGAVTWLPSLRVAGSIWHDRRNPTSAKLVLAN